MQIDYINEEKRFRERLECGYYSVDRAKNTGDDYVENGKLDRDIKAVTEYAASDDFDVIRRLK